MHARFAAALFMCAVALGCKHGDELGAPSVHLRLETGLCGWQAGIDGGNTLWYEQGCENGNPKMRRAGSTSAAKREALNQVIAALPRDTETLTQAQYLPVHTAMRGLFKIPAHDCNTPPVLVHQPESGQAYKWAVESCEASP